MSSTEVRRAAGARRKERPTGTVRTALARLTSREPSRFDSWSAAIWVVVIGLDFFWMANPVVLQPFDESLRSACIATSIAVVATLRRFQVPRPSWAVLAVLAFGFASARWSIDSAATVDFTTTFALIALLATVIAANADARTVCHGMMLGGVLVLLTSWHAFHDGLPHADVPDGTIGFLAGISGNRNILAYTMVLSLAFAVSFVPRHWWARSIWAVTVGVLLLGPFLAQSATGYLVTIVVLVAGGALMTMDLLRRPRVRSAPRRWATRALALVVVISTVPALELLGGALGRDPSTLSGRVQLWEAIWDSTTGRDRWFGSGWGAVWPRSWNSISYNDAWLEILQQTGYLLYHGHNSVFDLLPEIGIVGITVYLLTYIHAVMRALRLRDPRRGPTAARLHASRALLLGVLGLLLFGITEPVATVPFGWFVIVLLASGLRPTTEPGTPGRTTPAPPRGGRRRQPRRPASRT